MTILVLSAFFTSGRSITRHDTPWRPSVFPANSRLGWERKGVRYAWGLDAME
jgi:hypothetical protein